MSLINSTPRSQAAAHRCRRQMLPLGFTISAGRAAATWAGGNGWSSSTEEADECTLSSAQVAAVRAALAGTPPGCDYADTSLGSVLQNSSGA